MMMMNRIGQGKCGVSQICDFSKTKEKLILYVKNEL